MSLCLGWFSRRGVLVGIYSPIERASVFDVMRAWAGLVNPTWPTVLQVDP